MLDFVFIDDARVFGGGQRNVLRLARFINETLPGRSARVICPRDSELARQCRTAGIPIAGGAFPGLEFLAPVRIIRAVGALRRLLAGLDPETVVVGTSLRAQVYAHAAASTLRRRLRIVHFLPEQDSARRVTAKLLFRRYGAVVVVGENAAGRYRERLPGVHVNAVNNFLLPEEFAGAALRAEPPRDHDPPVVGVLARLIPEKGVLDLIDELMEYPDGWSELLVGGGAEDESHRRAIGERLIASGAQNRITLLGEVDDLAAFFAKIDLLIVPSTGTEGQPTVVLESLAFGRPVIVREPIWSLSFGGLPVTPYRDAADLHRALSHLQPRLVSPDVLATRFGPLHVLEALEHAAATP